MLFSAIITAHVSVYICSMVVHIQILFDNLDFAAAGSLMRINHRRGKVLHIGGGGGGGGGGKGKGKVEDIGGGARLRILVGGGGKGEPNFLLNVN